VTLERDEGEGKYVQIRGTEPRYSNVTIDGVNVPAPESGVRQILNFGHTMGHALETATGYKRFLHGEAVAWGMLGAALIGVGLGRLGERDASQIAALVARCGRLPELPRISSSTLVQIIAGDKKSRGGRVGWAIPRRIGATDIGIEAPDRLVATAWRELPRLFAQARGEIRRDSR